MTLTRGNELRTTTGLNTVRARHSVTGRPEPQIAVGVGPILILVADRAAIDSFVHAWRQADGTFPNTVYARQHDGRCLAVTPTAARWAWRTTNVPTEAMNLTHQGSFADST